MVRAGRGIFTSNTKIMAGLSNTNAEFELDFDVDIAARTHGEILSYDRGPKKCFRDN